MLSNKKIIVGVLVMIILGMILVIVAINSNKKTSGDIKISGENAKVTFDKTGKAFLSSLEGNFQKDFGSNSYDEFLKYLVSKIGSEPVPGGYEVTFYYNGKFYTVTLSADDPIIGSTFGGAGPSPTATAGPGGEDLFDGNFGSPSNGPSTPPGSGGGSGSGGGGGGGSSGGGSTPEEDDCPFWRLSYCVYPFPTNTPSPSNGPSTSPNPNPSSTPAPTSNGTETLWDCASWITENKIFTIISNQVCVPE